MTNENTISHEGAIERPRSWWVLDENAHAVRIDHERFFWVAIYQNGEELLQYEDHEDPDDGTYHRFNEIEFERLAEIHIHDTERPEFLYVMRIEQTQQPFMIYRVRRTVDIGVKDSETQTMKFAIVGWKDRETGAKVYNYFMPDGAIISANMDIRVE